MDFESQMLVVMQPGATGRQVQAAAELVRTRGGVATIHQGQERTLIEVAASSGSVHKAQLESLPGVESVHRLNSPLKLARRSPEQGLARVHAAGCTIGPDAFTLIAGPCSVENEPQTLALAESLHAAGVRLFRAGAFKPRTSPYSFQGLGHEGLTVLAAVKRRTGLGIVTEVLDPADVPAVEDVADVLQVGARNMQNYALLKRLGRGTRPVLLKRGMAATLEEWLLAAEYILAGGNRNVILCERGVRGVGGHARNILDLAVVPSARALTQLPILVDPSHATGRRALVPPMALAALAAGADGLLLEVHANPADALSDAQQAIDVSEFATLRAKLASLAPHFDRTIG